MNPLNKPSAVPDSFLEKRDHYLKQEVKRLQLKVYQHSKQAQERFSKAFDQLVEEADQVYVAGFKEAYDFRETYDWLPESQEDGLKAAWRTALLNYVNPDEYHVGFPDVEPDVDPHFVKELRSAFDSVLAEEDTFKEILRHIDRQSSIAVPKMDVKHYRQHLEAAMATYYEERRVGLSPDSVP